MRRAIELIPPSTAAREAARATVTLSFEDRHRRRIRLIDDAGEPFLLDLPRATQMQHGDLLRLEAGGSIEVRAAVEPVLEASCTTIEDTARIAWHIGNRHTPVQVLANGRLRLRHDHVLKDMLLGLGARVDEGEAPFAPESGAYHSGHGHAH